VKLLLDTHVWLWAVAAPDRLVTRVRRALGQASNEIWLSPISVWELLMLAERGRVRLRADPRAWVADVLRRTPLKEATLNCEVALRSREVALRHQDPVDRFLVATALTYELTLVTADETLIASRPCAILSNR